MPPSQPSRRESRARGRVPWLVMVAIAAGAGHGPHAHAAAAEPDPSAPRTSKVTPFHCRVAPRDPIAAVKVAAAAGTVTALRSSPVPRTLSQAPARRGSLDDVMRLLMCTCGCNLTLAACQASMPCQIAGRMRKHAEDLLARGMTNAQVIDAFAMEYGERVLAAPTKRGFNLTAWVLPFVGLALGALAVTLALMRWRRRVPLQAEAAASEVDPGDAAAVEEEVLRRL